MYDDKKECFQAHIARANKQLENYENQEVLIVFQGPHAYVSSSWYDHPNVPTWNYVAVHVYGQLQIVKDKTDIKKALIDLVNHHEKQEDQPLDIDKIDDIINKEMRGITFFEINSLRFEGVKKLSQNRHAQDYSNIISHLENKGQENLIDFMKKVIK
jgi:transcriptional regulator